MIFYILYGLAVVAVIGLSYFLIKWNHVISFLIGISPALLSVYLMWSFIDANNNVPVPCGETTGCMNETGLLIVLALFFITISCVVLSLAVFSMRPTNKTKV